jgi:hypothetical protein
MAFFSSYANGANAAVDINSVERSAYYDFEYAYRKIDRKGNQWRR